MAEPAAFISFPNMLFPFPKAHFIVRLNFPILSAHEGSVIVPLLQSNILHSFGVFILVVMPDAATNIKRRPNASAADTYTGTIAKFISSIKLNFPSRTPVFHFQKKYIKPNTGEIII